jgi:hypothetical protein
LESAAAEPASETGCCFSGDLAALCCGDGD